MTNSHSVAGGVYMIGHDDLRGAINQIPNIWDELEREGPLDLDWVVAVESFHHFISICYALF